MEENKCMKWFSLVFLTLQNVSLVLLMRYVRTRPQEMFINSTAVVCSELIKLLASFLIILYSFKFNIRKVFQHILQDPHDWALIAVPAVIYVIQNNLIFIAVSNLDAATFQVCYQLKLLTTAVFFRILLHRSQSRLQWSALFLLFIGIVLVQIQYEPSSPNAIETTQNRFLGVSVVLIGSILSGFAGVFFERLLKSNNSGRPQRNVWVRNFQLASYGAFFGLVGVAATEGPSILLPWRMQSDFLRGYDPLVWAVVMTQSIGGLLVAVVVKYADNILKGFATTVAIVLAAAVSVPLFGVSFSPLFLIGATAVVMATGIYSAAPTRSQISPSEPTLAPTTVDKV